MILKITSVIYISIIIIIAHVIAPKEYNWRINSISELAAQKYRHRIVMQMGFIGFGMLLALSVISNSLEFKNFDIKYIFILIYSVSIFITGIFSTKPFISEQEYVKAHHKLHSFFAQIAGFSFSLGILTFFFEAANIYMKIIHFGFFAFVILVSMMFGKLNTIRGILQRVLYCGSFIWILFYL